MYILLSSSSNFGNFLLNKLFLISQTNVQWNDDLSDINLSLNNPFENNGKKIYFGKNMDFKLDNLQLNYITSSENGGPLVFNDPNVEYFIQNTKIDHNSGLNGGGLYITTKYPLFLKNVSFKNNTATNYGGTVCSIATISSFHIFDTYFENSFSISYGGAIYISSSTANISIIESTFFNCSSNYMGGSIHISSSSLTVDITKVCFSYNYISTSGNSLYGTSFYIYSSNTFLLKFNLVSIGFGGKTGWSTGTMRISGGEQRLKSINATENKAYDCSFGYINPSFSSSFQYMNYFNCSQPGTSYSYYFIYSSYQYDMDNCNFISNKLGSYGIYYSASQNYRFIINYCIFINNTGGSYLLYSNSQQTIRSSFIIHSGSIFYSFSSEYCVTNPGYYTQTHLLTHYSTYLCLTPNELGGLEIENQNCQTQPPIPTTCNFETNQEQISIMKISKVLEIMLLPLINLNYN